MATRQQRKLKSQCSGAEGTKRRRVDSLGPGKKSFIDTSILGLDLHAARCTGISALSALSAAEWEQARRPPRLPDRVTVSGCRTVRTVRTVRYSKRRGVQGFRAQGRVGERPASIDSPFRGMLCSRQFSRGAKVQGMGAGT